MTNSDNIEIWTDGSCNNKKPTEGYRVGGAAAIMTYKGKFLMTAASEQSETTASGRMELVAIALALKTLRSPKNAIVYSDSEYAVDICNKSKVGQVNTDIIDDVFFHIERFLQSGKTITFKWIAADSHPYNRLAHDLANQARHCHLNYEQKSIIETKTKRH